MAEPVVRVPCSVWRASGYATGERAIPEETAVAFTYNTASYAVMMATPQDLEDFAVGFSLTEGVTSSVDAIENVEIAEEEIGIELAHLAQDAGRRRVFDAPPQDGWSNGVRAVRHREPDRGHAAAASRARRSQRHAGRDHDGDRISFPLQELNRETRAVHGAGFFDPARGLVAVREDVGRHNALDKLAGALAREGANAANGIVVLTSRVSVEMVQKSAVIGAPSRRGLGADRACAPHGRGLRHDAGGRRQEGWVRGVHPSAPYQRRACRSATPAAARTP